VIVRNYARVIASFHFKNKVEPHVGFFY